MYKVLNCPFSTMWQHVAFYVPWSSALNIHLLIFPLKPKKDPFLWILFPYPWISFEVIIIWKSLGLETGRKRAVGDNKLEILLIKTTLLPPAQMDLIIFIINCAVCSRASVKIPRAASPEPPVKTKTVSRTFIVIHIEGSIGWSSASLSFAIFC